MNVVSCEIVASAGLKNPCLSALDAVAIVREEEAKAQTSTIQAGVISRK